MRTHIKWKLYCVTGHGPAQATEVSSFFLMRIPMVTQSRIPGGGGGEGVGDMAATQSRKKVVAEARGGVGSVRRINEGGGKVRVLGCWGGTAPVTSPKYRECSRGGSGRPVEGGGMARR
jgi:hypothetical protein